jgi:hypothetical protein
MIVPTLNRVKRFALWMTLGTLVVVPTMLYLKNSIPLLHDILSLIGRLALFYFALRYIYEHWDD